MLSIDAMVRFEPQCQESEQKHANTCKAPQLIGSSIGTLTTPVTSRDHKGAVTFEFTGSLLVDCLSASTASLCTGVAALCTDVAALCTGMTALCTGVVIIWS